MSACDDFLLWSACCIGLPFVTVSVGSYLSTVFDLPLHTGVSMACIIASAALCYANPQPRA